MSAPRPSLLLLQLIVGGVKNRIPMMDFEAQQQGLPDTGFGWRMPFWNPKMRPQSLLFHLHPCSWTYCLPLASQWDVPCML